MEAIPNNRRLTLAQMTKTVLRVYGLMSNDPLGGISKGWLAFRPHYFFFMSFLAVLVSFPNLNYIE